MPAVNVSDSVSTEIAPADYYRTIIVVSNSSTTADLHVNFGFPATTGEGFIGPRGNMTITGDARVKCAINGISSSGTIVAKYSKLSAGG